MKIIQSTKSVVIKDRGKYNQFIKTISLESFYSEKEVLSILEDSHTKKV